MEPVRIALIGCGSIAEKHVRAIAELGSAAQVVALCDVDRTRMARIAGQINRTLPAAGLALHADAASCLGRQDVDLAVITTSTDSHIPLTLAALESGKHVLVEKPLALSIGEARFAAQVAARRGRILGVSLQTRYLPQIRAMKRAADEGEFGRLMHGVVSVRWNRNDGYYRSSPWRNSWATGGGALINQCIHYIDLLQWMMGPVVSVYGQAAALAEPVRAEQVGIAVLTFAGGAIGIVEGSTCVYPANLSTSIGLFGEKGSAVLEGERLDRIRHWRFAADGGAERTDIRTAGISHAPMYKDLIDAIRLGASPLVSADTTLHSLEVVLAIYKSIAEGRPIRLPLDEFAMKSMIREGKS